MSAFAANLAWSRPLPLKLVVLLDGNEPVAIGRDELFDMKMAGITIRLQED